MTVAAIAQQALSGTQKLMVVAASRLPGKVHVLPATLETTQWGWFDNAELPRLTVDSGDTVVFETMSHAHGQLFPGRSIDELFDEDLDKALDGAKSETAKLLAEQRKIPAEQAAGLLPALADCRITQVVDIKRGVHCMVPKDAASARPVAARPSAETADSLVTSARGPSMNKSIDEASWGMIELLQKAKGLSRLDAYALASISMDCRIGEIAAADKSVHCLVPKGLWVQR